MDSTDLLEKNIVRLSTLLLCLTSIVLLGCGPQQPDTLARIEKRETLKIGVLFSSYPWIYKDSKGNPTGFEIALIQKLAKALVGNPKAYQLIEVPTTDRLRELNTRRTDMFIGTFSATPERDKVFDFSQPYVTSKFRLMVRDDSGIKDLSDLPGKRVSMVFGATSESILREHVPPGTQLVGLHHLKDARRSFEEGRLDVFAEQEGVLMDYLIKHCGVKILPQPLATAKYVIAIKQGDEGKRLLNKLNALLNEWEKDGTLPALRRQWLIEPKYHPCLPIPSATKATTSP